MSVTRRDAVMLLAILAIAAPLFSIQLGNHYLWQDEAQTALISRTILDGGIPRGYDGRNHFSQELGIEYGENYVWRWHTWLPFYLVAGSFAAYSLYASPSLIEMCPMQYAYAIFTPPNLVNRTRGL